MHIHALLVCSLCYNAHTVLQRGAVNEREEDREGEGLNQEGLQSAASEVALWECDQTLCVDSMNLN